ncbi:MarR family transcriptional regulator [Streptomyces sp. NPDC010273]|uniref:MarR family transcriptional regulator n=1 Tax=Streptomyces sp. NPDC010273 TaxID=3364829 RepID=UPI0036E8B460
MHDLVVSEAGRVMQSEFGLSGAEYPVLAELTRAPGARLRILELTKVLGWEKSRVSHQLARSSRARRPRLTIGAAAPRHAEDVRRLLLDRLTPGQVTMLAEISETVIGQIGEMPR